MKGRRIFSIFKPILNLLVLVLKVFPNFLIQVMWDIASVFSGKLFVGFRYVLLKSRCRSVGDNVYIGKYVIIKSWENLVLGNNVSIHDFCYVDATGGINIGNNVSIAHNCTVLTKNHDWRDTNIPIKYNNEIILETSIMDDVWLGCGVRVLAGITIGTRVVVAAGAIVTKEVASYSVMGGIPAKKIKSLESA